MKIATNIFLVVGILLFVSWPWILGARPPVADRHAGMVYAAKSGLYVVSLILIFFTTVVLAWRVARQAREDYRQESIANMQQLIESAREDLRKRNAEHGDS